MFGGSEKIKEPDNKMLHLVLIIWTHLQFLMNYDLIYLYYGQLFPVEPLNILLETCNSKLIIAHYECSLH